jgi:ClpP class serine protease
MAKHWRWMVVFALLVLAVAWLLVGRGPVVEEDTVLVVDLEGSYVEASATPVLARLFGARERPLIALLSELAKAERDERLSTVLFRIRPLDIGWGKADEIRAAIARVSERGRRTIAYLEIEKYGANLEYFVASGADEIHMAPGSRNPFVGLAAEVLFLGGFFEKIGVDIEYERIGKYKSAVESFAESKMSEANREMTGALLDSVYERFVAAIAEGRALSTEQVHSAIDAAPTTPAEMQEHGLTDGIGFFDEILRKARGGPPERPVMEAEEYARVDPSSVGFDPVASFALIYGTGPVVTDAGSDGPGGRRALAATTVSEAFEAASEDGAREGQAGDRLVFGRGRLRWLLRGLRSGPHRESARDLYRLDRGLRTAPDCCGVVRQARYRRRVDDARRARRAAALFAPALATHAQPLARRRARRLRDLRGSCRGGPQSLRGSRRRGRTGSRLDRSAGQRARSGGCLGRPAHRGPGSQERGRPRCG